MKFKYGNLYQKTRTTTITSDETLTASSAQIQFLNPSGATWKVLLPLESDVDGVVFNITNTGSTYNLTIRNSIDNITIDTITPGFSAFYICNGVDWKKTTGSIGYSGYSGYSGITGNNGAPGVSGYSGYSGFSGNNNPTAAMLSQNGFQAWNSTYAVDNNTTTHAFYSDSAVSGYYVRADLGEGNDKYYQRFRMFSDRVGHLTDTYTGSYDVEYSDNASSWTTVYTGFIPVLDGWNSCSWTDVGTHRYWQIKITNTPGAHWWYCNEIEWSVGGPGASGYSGYSGSGVSGYSGYSGSGVSGYSGYSGLNGASASSGYSGYSGYSGITGSNGAPGVSGYSGYSGTIPWTRNSTSGYVYPTTDSDMVVIGTGSTTLAPKGQSHIKSTADARVINTWVANSDTQSADIWQVLSGANIWSYMDCQSSRIGIHTDTYWRRTINTSVEAIHWLSVIGASVADGTATGPKYGVGASIDDQSLLVEINKIYCIPINFQYEAIRKVKLLLRCTGNATPVTITAGFKYWTAPNTKTATTPTTTVSSSASYQVIEFDTTDYTTHDPSTDTVYGVFGNVSNLLSATMYIAGFGVVYTAASNRTNP